MPEQIGGLEMELGLNSRGLENQLKKVEAELGKIQRGGENAQQAFSDLYNKIRDLSRVTKDSSGKEIPGVITASQANKAISYIDTIARKYNSLNSEFEKAKNSKFSAKLDLTDAFRDITRLKNAISSFYNRSGEPLEYLGTLLKGANFGEIKHNIDTIMRSATVSEKGITSQIKSLQALEKEYITYSNLAKASIVRVETISKSADASLQKSIAKYGLDDARVRDFRDKIDAFKSIKQGWQYLIHNAETTGEFPKSVYRNYYQEHRKAQGELFKSGVDLGLRNFDETSFISLIQRIMSQTDKLYDSYRKIDDAKSKLLDVKGIATESERRNIDAQLKKLDEYKEKLQQIEKAKLGEKLAFRDSSTNRSIVGADFRNLITESSSISSAIKKGSLEAIAFDKQLDTILAKKNDVISVLNRLQQAQSSGFSNNLTSANSKEMENISKQIVRMKEYLSDIKKYENGAMIPSIAFGKVFTQELNNAKKSAQEMDEALKRMAKEEAYAIAKSQSLVVAQQNIKDIISDVERKVKDVGNAMSKPKVSDTTLSSLDAVKGRLERIIDDYKTILSDSSMLRDKGILASVSSDRKSAFSDAGILVKKANSENKLGVNSQLKNLSDIEKAETQLRDYIRRLNTEYEKSGSKTFHKDVDTQRYDEARESIKKLIEKYEEWLSLLKKGKSLSEIGFSTKEVRGEKKDVLAEMNVARTLTNEADRQARATDRVANSTKNKMSVDDESAKSIGNLINKYKQLSDASKGASSAIGEVKNMLMQFAPVYGLQQTVMSIIEVGGEIEKQHIALQTILGDIQSANVMFEDLKRLALQSPFTFGELTRDVKQLAAYNVEYKDLYDTTKRLADISSGLGVSFDRIALAYGQVKSRSWLDAKELRQFAYAGVPLLQSLSEMYSQTQGKSVSKAKVRKMITNREVSFEDVQKVLWNMTNEGGKFYNMQLVLSETLLGRYNKLKDAWEIMLSGFAKSDGIVGGALKGILNFFTEIVLHVNTVIPLLTSFFAMFVARKTAKLGSLAVERGITRENQLQAIEEIKKAQAEGVINSAKIKELITTRQITIAEARHLGLISAQTAATMRLGFTMKGIATVAQGMWTAIGGWVGIAIASITYLFTYFSTKNSEMTQAISQTTDELRDKYKKVTEFQKSKLRIDTSDISKAKKSLQEYIEFIKENAPYISNDVISDISSTDNFDEKLEKAKAWVKVLRDGNRYALGKSPSVVKESKDAFDEAKKSAESLRQNLIDYEKEINNMDKAYIGYISRAFINDNKKTGEQKEIASLLSKEKDIDEQRKLIVEYMTIGMTDRNVEKNAESIYESMSRALGSAADKVKSSPEIMLAYKQIRESLEEGLDEEFKNKLNARIDQLFGIDVSKDAEHEIVIGLMEQLTNIGNDVDDKTREIMHTIANRIRYGEELTDAEKKIVSKLMYKAGEDIRDKYPIEIEGVINNLLKSSNFVANIKLHIEEDDINDLAKALRHESDSSEFTNKLEQYTKDKTLPEAQKSVDDDLKKVSEDIKATKRNSQMNALGKSERLKDLMKNQEELQELQKRIGKPISKSENGARKDVELESLRKRIQAVERFIKLYKEYVKMYGEFEAKRRITNDVKGLGFDGYNFSDVVGVREKLLIESQKLLEKNPKSEQRKALRDTNKEKKQEEILNKEKEDLEGISDAYSEINAKIKEMYALRDSISSKYGKTKAYELAGSVSYYNQNGEPVIMGLGKTYAISLRKQIEQALKNSGKDGNYTVDSLLGMNTDEIEKAIGKGIFGETDVVSAVKSLKEEEARLQKESTDTVVSILDMNKSTEAEVSRIWNALEDTIVKINNNKNLSDEEKSGLIDTAKTKASFDILEKTADYGAIFNKNWVLSRDIISSVADAIENNLNDAFKNGVITADDYKKKIMEINKARMAYNSNGMFGKSGNANIFLKSGVNGLVSYYSDMASYAFDKSQEVGITDEEKKKWNELSDIYTKYTDNLIKFSNGLNIASEAISIATGVFEGFGKVADSLTEMFNALGDENLANKWSDISDGIKAISSITSPASGIVESAMSGNISGVISNAISAPIQMITSPITGFAKLHDKKLQRQIDIAIQNQKILQTLSSNMQNTLEKSFGGLYNNKVDISIIDSLKEKIKPQWIKKAGIKIYSQKYSDNTISQVEEAERTRSYYDTMIASLMMQKDEATNKLSNERAKKNSDDSAIEDYKQEIRELEEQLRDFSGEMANALYGVDFKSWADNFANAIVNAWASGTNAVKAYKDAVADVVKNSAISVIQQKIIETALEPVRNEFLDYFDKNNGVLDSTGINILSKLFDVAENATNKSFEIMDEAENIAQNKGYTLKNKSTGLSPAIAGVTEDTADLLGSYINSIRAYCASNNSYFMKLSEEQVPFISATLQSQLAQLRQVQENTRRSANASSELRDMIYNMTLGINPMHVKITQ